MFLELIFWISLAGLLHSYVFFPLLLNLLAKGKSQNKIIYGTGEDSLPEVTVLLAAYNEERVIEQKITSTFQSTYPASKIKMLVGSDASTDRTNEIVLNLQSRYTGLKLIEFGGRTGKSAIINRLAELADTPVYILTDANVFFKEDTIYELVKHFKHEGIGLVGGNILNIRFKKDGISFQEKQYLSRENTIKYQEGVVWGAMIGAFGGCYSIRAANYAPVPPRFFMDDFYITMNVLKQGKKTINELDALCYEDVSNKISEEFRRKVRISIGNFQNLVRYASLLWPPSGLAFAFFSHKVLRWLGPFFIIAMLISAFFLANETPFYRLLLVVQLALIAVPILDELLKKANIHVLLLRFISHFYLMNLALFIGFIKFIKGVKSNVWQPTQRFQ